jgi:Uma2 family endonuclease
MKGGPDIAVEIVSRDSRTRDYVEKKQLYLDAGVPEYWLIDLLAGRCEFLQLVDGRYEPIPLENNRIFKSRALPGFWLDVEWLLADPPANDYHCLQAILSAQ